MSLPITIEGKQLFASLPTLADFRAFKEFLQRARRRDAYAALPSGLSDEQLKQFIRVVDADCRSIDAFQSFADLAETPDGAALLFYSLLRHENAGITLDWVSGLMERAESGRAESLLGLRSLREALAEMLRAKKNELQPPGEAANQQSPPTSTLSTSD